MTPGIGVQARRKVFDCALIDVARSRPATLPAIGRRTSRSAGRGTYLYRAVDLGALPRAVDEVAPRQRLLDQRERLMREITELHEEVEALGIGLLALEPLGRPTPIERLIPSASVRVPSLETSSVETSGRVRCRSTCRCHSRGGRLDLWGVNAAWIEEPVVTMMAGVTGEIGERLAAAGREVYGATHREPRQAMLDEPRAVLMAEIHGASNAKAKHELGWRPAHPSSRRRFTTA